MALSLSVYDATYLVLALKLALLSSYGHISFPAGAVLHLHQQWGIWCIAASVALTAPGYRCTMR